MKNKTSVDLYNNELQYLKDEGKSLTKLLHIWFKREFVEKGISDIYPYDKKKTEGDT